MQRSYRIEYRGRGPFSSPQIFAEIRSLIIEHADENIDRFGTTFLNFYDQVMSEGFFSNRPLRRLLEGAEQGELQFGFVSKEAMMEHFGLDLDHGGYRQQFAAVLNNCPDFVVRVYDVEPLCFHNSKKEVVYKTREAKLVREVHSFLDFLKKP